MEEKKIGVIKAELESLIITDLQGFIDAYKLDERGGVQKLVATAEKRKEKYLAELTRTENLKNMKKSTIAFAISQALMR